MLVPDIYVGWTFITYQLLELHDDKYVNFTELLHLP